MDGAIQCSVYTVKPHSAMSYTVFSLYTEFTELYSGSPRGRVVLRLLNRAIPGHFSLTEGNSGPEHAPGHGPAVLQPGACPGHHTHG